MGIFDFLSGEFIDVIHWVDDSRDTMVWRFEREGHEIKYGAKLTVREGQAAVFVHEGQLADVFTPGLYMLETNNMPIMTTLQHWDHGFKSPFKSEIYFVNTTRFNDLKWGTKNPIICRDPEFGPVRLRAFGTYSVKVADPAKFLVEIVGTDGEFTMDEISFQIRNIIVQEMSRSLAQSGIPVMDMAANTRELGQDRGQGHFGPDRGIWPVDPRTIYRKHFTARRGRSRDGQTLFDGRGRESEQLHAVSGRRSPRARWCWGCSHSDRLGRWVGDANGSSCCRGRRPLGRATCSARGCRRSAAPASRTRLARRQRRRNDGPFLQGAIGTDGHQRGAGA